MGKDMRQKAENVGQTPEVYKVFCRLTGVQMRKQGEKVPFHYIACAEPREGSSLLCNRRVDQSGFCAACNRAGKTAVRLSARACFADYEQSVWLSCFNESAGPLFDMDGDAVAKLDDGVDTNREKLESLIQSRYFGDMLEVTVRSKLDSYQGEPRANSTCGMIAPVNRRARGREMLAEIQAMLA